MSKIAAFVRQEIDVEALANQIIDAIPEAMGITPDPWPQEGERARDGEPHKTIERIIREAITL